jgi:hypothetical protein
MSGVGGKAAYTSGLEFCESIEQSPAVVRDIVAWLVNAAARVSAAAAAAQPDVPEVLCASYLQCTFDGGEWLRLYVDDPRQPANGFTIATPSDESEVDVLCRAYERGGVEAQRTMRTSFERAIALNKR